MVMEVVSFILSILVLLVTMRVLFYLALGFAMLVEKCYVYGDKVRFALEYEILPKLGESWRSFNPFSR